MSRNGPRSGRQRVAALGLVLCGLAAPAWADDADTGGSWGAVDDGALEELRGGLRVGGMEMSLDLIVRDLVDGHEVQRRTLAVDDLADALLPLVNQRDGVTLRRDATLLVRVRGFREKFSTGSARSVRRRIARSLESRP